MAIDVLEKNNLEEQARELMDELGFESWEYEDSEFYEAVQNARNYTSGLDVLVGLANEILWDGHQCSATHSAELFFGA